MNRRLLPHLTLNVAMSADGRMMAGTRELTAIAKADAIMMGARMAESAWRNVRSDTAAAHDGAQQQKIRVIVSGNATVDPNESLLECNGQQVVILTSERAAKRNIHRLQQRTKFIRSFGAQQLDLAAALAGLRTEFGIRRIVCKGGSTLNDALLRAGLVDELHLSVAPAVIGGAVAPTWADGIGFQNLEEAMPVKLVSMRKSGAGILWVFKCRKNLAV